MKFALRFIVSVIGFQQECKQQHLYKCSSHLITAARNTKWYSQSHGIFLKGQTRKKYPTIKFTIKNSIEIFLNSDGSICSLRGNKKEDERYIGSASLKMVPRFVRATVMFFWSWSNDDHSGKVVGLAMGEENAVPFPIEATLLISDVHLDLNMSDQLHDQNASVKEGQA